MSAHNIHAYSEPVWQRFSAPRHAGGLAAGAGVHEAQAGSVAARSLLRLAVQMQAGAVVQARFKAYGCPSAIAVGEWLAEQLQGRSLESLRLSDFAAPVIRAALEIPEDRAHCALMGEDAVRALIAQLQDST